MLIILKKVGKEVKFDNDTFFGLFMIKSESKVNKNKRKFRMKSLFFRSTENPDRLYVINDKDIYDSKHPRAINIEEMLEAFDKTPMVQKYEMTIKYDKKK
jgi:hypothetical protein